MYPTQSDSLIMFSKNKVQNANYKKNIKYMLLFECGPTVSVLKFRKLLYKGVQYLCVLLDVPVDLFLYVINELMKYLHNML